MSKFIKILIPCLFVIFNSVNAQNHKFQMWQSQSFFRGFNILTTHTHPLQDFIDLKATGANLVQLGIAGFLDVDPPYNVNQIEINTTDSLINFCRFAGLYYTIAIRSGPGRRDVYLESEANQPKSTIWKNRDEQILYGHMLREITDRYKNDTFFVGLGIIVEPNPLFDSLQLNALTLRNNLARNGIDFKFINQTLIDSV